MDVSGQHVRGRGTVNVRPGISEEQRGGHSAWSAMRKGEGSQG